MRTKTKIMIIVIVIVVILPVMLLAAWILAGYLPTRNVATPGYTVVEKKAGYEVRLYDDFVVAETVQNGSHDNSLNAGFGELFQYITGNNSRTTKVPMTAPVLHTEATAGQAIPMTAPVLSQAAGGRHSVAFVMPPGSTLADLPAPRSAKVTLRAVPRHKAAVISFSGTATEAVMQARAAALRACLARDGRRALAAPQEAFYNPPWTPPFMRRNEVMVTIE